ncbi:olfactory receptor 4F15 [Clostridioides difficile]|nr:olfactory receptor 4F15 [Clostridioides difficile]MDB3522130.1 olfactory receptor 4F15 [Clostridioides difficile]
MIFVWSLKFYHKPVRSCSILSNKKARFYAGCGVSQTPSYRYFYGGSI